MPKLVKSVKIYRGGARPSVKTTVKARPRSGPSVKPVKCPSMRQHTKHGRVLRTARGPILVTTPPCMDRSAEPLAN